MEVNNGMYMHLYIFPARNDTLYKKTSLDRRDLKASKLVASITYDGNEFFANCD